MGRIEAEPKGAAETGPTGLVAREIGMAGEEGRKVLADADGTDTGTASAVGNAKGLVEVEMADIGAELAGVDESHLRVEVGSIEIDLAAVGVHDLADLADPLLEDAVGGGVGDHDRSESVWRSACAFSRRSSTSTLPCSSQRTPTTSMAAICAEAGLVPCAEAGMRQMLRWASPRLRW